jgi:hypothetical protein
MTTLKTKDIPAIIGLSSEALAKLMDDMGKEYCLWWCGQANAVDADILYQNDEFQDWWLTKWLIQDERFLSYATAKMKMEKSIGSTAMMVSYLAYHRAANEKVEADGSLTMWKTMLPAWVQRSFEAKRTGLDRAVRGLIQSISDN